MTFANNYFNNEISLEGLPWTKAKAIDKLNGTPPHRVDAWAQYAQGRIGHVSGRSGESLFGNVLLPVQKEALRPCQSLWAREKKIR